MFTVNAKDLHLSDMPIEKLHETLDSLDRLRAKVAEVISAKKAATSSEGEKGG